MKQAFFHVQKTRQLIQYDDGHRLDREGRSIPLYRINQFSLTDGCKFGMEHCVALHVPPNDIPATSLYLLLFFLSIHSSPLSL